MWIQIISSIIGMATLVTVIVYNLKINQDIKKVPIRPNAADVENKARMQFTKGYSSGRLKVIEKCKNGCDRIRFYPTDIEETGELPLPEIQTVIVKKEFVKPLATGKGSTRREKIILVGRSPLDYPEEMRNTEEGKWATVEGQKAFILASIGQLIPTGDQAMGEVLKDFSRVGVTKSAFAQMKEVNEQWRKSSMQQPQTPPEEKPKE